MRWSNTTSARFATWAETEACLRAGDERPIEPQPIQPGIGPGGWRVMPEDLFRALMSKGLRLIVSGASYDAICERCAALGIERPT